MSGGSQSYLVDGARRCRCNFPQAPDDNEAFFSPLGTVVLRGEKNMFASFFSTLPEYAMGFAIDRAEREREGLAVIEQSHTIKNLHTRKYACWCMFDSFNKVQQDMEAFGVRAMNKRRTMHTYRSTWYCSSMYESCDELRF